MDPVQGVLGSRRAGALSGDAGAGVCPAPSTRRCRRRSRAAERRSRREPPDQTGISFDSPHRRAPLREPVREEIERILSHRVPDRFRASAIPPPARAVFCGHSFTGAGAGSCCNASGGRSGSRSVERGMSRCGARPRIPGGATVLCLRRAPGGRGAAWPYLHPVFRFSGGVYGSWRESNGQASCLPHL